MTHKEKIEALEKAIREALPETKEISRGCRFETENGLEYIDGVLDQGFVRTTDVNGLGNVHLIESLKENCNNLGHEIQLHHVLKWLVKEDYPFSLSEHQFYINESHRFSIDYSKWNLKDQSERFIDCLYGLI